MLKPAEFTPFTSLLFAEIATEAGVPDGVINIVDDQGPVAGAALLRHRDVAMLSFTGSTAAGRTVLRAAATTAKRVHLELGGKAPFVVFDDADLEAAIHGAVAGSPINTGQDCTQPPGRSCTDRCTAISSTASPTCTPRCGSDRPTTRPPTSAR